MQEAGEVADVFVVERPGVGDPRRRPAGEVEHLDPEVVAVGPVDERPLVDAQADHRDAAEPVVAPDDQGAADRSVIEQDLRPTLRDRLEGRHRDGALHRRDRRVGAGERLDRAQVARLGPTRRERRQEIAEDAVLVLDDLPAVEAAGEHEVAAVADPSLQGEAPEVLEGCQRLGVVEVQDQGLDRVVAVPSVGDAFGDPEPGDPEPARLQGVLDLELRHLRQEVDASRIAGDGDHQVLRVEPIGRVLGGPVASPLPIVEDLDLERGIGVAGPGVAEERGARSRRDFDPTDHRRGDAAVVRDGQAEHPGEGLRAPLEVDPHGGPGPELVGGVAGVLGESDADVLDGDGGLALPGVRRGGHCQHRQRRQGGQGPPGLRDRRPHRVCLSPRSPSIVDGRG